MWAQQCTNPLHTPRATSIFGSLWPVCLLGACTWHHIQAPGMCAEMWVSRTQQPRGISTNLGGHVSVPAVSLGHSAMVTEHYRITIAWIITTASILPTALSPLQTDGSKPEKSAVISNIMPYQRETDPAIKLGASYLKVWPNIAGSFLSWEFCRARIIHLKKTHSCLLFAHHLHLEINPPSTSSRLGYWLFNIDTDPFKMPCHLVLNILKTEEF